MPDDATMVRALLDQLGIAPDDDEIARLATGYGELRARAERLHAVDCGDEVPALVLRAAEISGPGRG